MLKRFFTAIKMWWKSSTLDLIREATRLRTFDLVAFNENPSFEDLYFIYATSDDECYLIRLADYNKNKDHRNLYDADLDKQIIYSYKDCQRYFHKVMNRTLKAEEILIHPSQRELQTFASRMCRISDYDYPVFCWFIDKRDDHVMFVGAKERRDGEDILKVFDITIALGTGIYHNLPYTHLVKYKDIRDKMCLKTTYGPDLVGLLHNRWRREVIADISKTIFSTIASSEIKYDKYSVFANSMTLCNNLNGQNSSMQTTQCRKEKK